MIEIVEQESRPIVIAAKAEVTVVEIAVEDAVSAGRLGKRGELRP